MLTENAQGNKSGLSAQWGKVEREPPRDVFGYLYKDAMTKRQAQEEAERLKSKEIIPNAPRLRSYLPSQTPQRRDSKFSTNEQRAGVTQGSRAGQQGHEGNYPWSSSTAFQTNKRVDALALPRGSENTPVTLPTPNYGRVLNFTEEEERMKRRTERRCSLPLHQENINVTIPTRDPKINRLATPKRCVLSAPVSRENSLCHLKGQQNRTKTVHRPLPVFRFK